jgi:hypothetical protein
MVPDIVCCGQIQGNEMNGMCGVSWVEGVCRQGLWHGNMKG